MVSWEFPPDAVGGVSAHVDALTRAMARAGHDVVVLTIASSDREDDTIESGVRVLRAHIDLPWMPDDHEVGLAASANNQLVALASRLSRMLGTWRPDVVHHHDWRTAWAGDTLASLFRCPLITTLHGTERGRHGGHVPIGTSEAVNSIENWIAWRADRVVCSSRFMVREVIDCFEIDGSRIVLIPNGVDPREWAPGGPALSDDTLNKTSTTSSTSSHDREPLVLAWGRVQYEKGFQVLVQAMGILRGRVPGVRCIIAGRGPYLAELQSQIDNEGVSDVVNLAGYVPDDELRSLLHNAGCVVIPSLYEPFGIVALEAMAAGAPVVVSRTGGLAEIVDGTNAGLTFEPGQANDMARLVELVLTDDDTRQRLRTSSIETLRNRYSWDAIASTTVEMYAGLITSR